MALAALLAVAAALASLALCLRRCAALASQSSRHAAARPAAPRAARLLSRDLAPRVSLASKPRRLGALLLSAVVLRQARRQGLVFSVEGIGYLSASDVTVTTSKARTSTPKLKALRETCQRASRLARAPQGPVRRVTVREASYTGPVMSLLHYGAAAWRRRRAARTGGASAAAPGTPGTPSAPHAASHAASVARLHLPVTLRGLRITVQARATPPGEGSTASSVAATPPPRTPPQRASSFCAGGGGTSVTPRALARSASLLAPRQLLASGRWRLVARLARLLDITLADVSIDVLPAAPAAASAAVQLRLRRVVLSAGAPGGAALRLSARAEGVSLRLRRRRRTGFSAGGVFDTGAAADALDAACWEEGRRGAEDGPYGPSCAPFFGGADAAALAWLELGAEIEHDAVAGATRCARLEIDAGAFAGGLSPELAAALRRAPTASLCLPPRADTSLTRADVQGLHAAEGPASIRLCSASGAAAGVAHAGQYGALPRITLPRGRHRLRRPAPHRIRYARLSS
jgi:hypothetical protein